jgi:hypothetical protein
VAFSDVAVLFFCCCCLLLLPPATCLKLGLDYSDLRDYLAAGDVRKADDETRALLIKMAGQGAVQRGWVYFTGQWGVGQGPALCSMLAPFATHTRSKTWVKLCVLHYFVSMWRLLWHPGIVTNNGCLLPEQTNNTAHTV